MVLLAGTEIRMADMILDLICTIGLCVLGFRAAQETHEKFAVSGEMIHAAIGVGLVGFLLLTILAVWL